MRLIIISTTLVSEVSSKINGSSSCSGIEGKISITGDERDVKVIEIDVTLELLEVSEK